MGFFFCIQVLMGLCIVRFICTDGTINFSITSLLVLDRDPRRGSPEEAPIISSMKSQL